MRGSGGYLEPLNIRDNMNKQLKITIKTDKRERFIGTFDPKTNVFYKVVKERFHLFRKFDAWGIDSEVFNDILLPKNCTIRVFDTEHNIDYYITAKDFKKHSRYFHFIREEDNKAQIFCSRVNFCCVPRDYE